MWDCSEPSRIDLALTTADLERRDYETPSPIELALGLLKP